MRRLKTKDVFTMSRILKKLDMGIAADGKTQEQLGAEMILQIGENLHLAEKEVNEFIGSLLDMSAQEFSDLSLSKTLEYFEEFKKHEDIEAFFKLAGQLNKKQS